jgi:hypothetical protein
MHASVTRRRGYLYVPGRIDLSKTSNSLASIIDGSNTSSIFSHKPLHKYTLYLCKEGLVYVSGNSWLYRVTPDTSDVFGWAEGCRPWLDTGVWHDRNGLPLEFEKVSRVELLFAP